MKQILKSMLLLAATATAFTACNKEVDTQEPAKVDGMMNVRFSAVVDETETRATLTTEDEQSFTAAWEVDDEMTIEAHNTDGDGYLEEGTATWTGSYFNTNLPACETRGEWTYSAYYPMKESNPFGNERVQNGSNYNSEYDIMKGDVSYSDANLGFDNDGERMVIPMTRLTSILYFHLTSSIDEPLASATLSVEGESIAAEVVTVNGQGIFDDPEVQKYNDITLTFASGSAPSAQDFRLWFNILPAQTTGLTLTITTTYGKTATLRNTKGKTYVAGKVNKVVKNGLTWSTSPQPQEYSIVFIDKTNKTVAPINTSTLASTIIESASLDYVTTSPFTTATKAFYGGNETNGLPVRIGTSSDPGTLTIALSEAGKVFASSIIVNAKQYSNGKTKKIGVNNSTKQQPGDDYGDLEFTLNSDIQEISLQTDGYVYVKYVKVIYTPKSPVTLSFPEASYTITAGESFEAPSVTTNPPGLPVTYSSSNQTVATVNSSTGAVSLEGGIGSTTITATFAGDDTYNSGSAYYVLTVNRAAATSIAQIKSDLANGATEFNATLTNAIVTRKYSDYIAYLQDGTAGILVTDAQELTQGDSYSGPVSGEMETNQNQPRITSIDVSGAVKTPGATIPAPVEVSIATLTSNMSSYDGKLCKIVKAKAEATLATGNNKSVSIAQGENKMTMFTRASFEENTVIKDGYYDIIGVPCLFGSTKEIVVLSTSDVSASAISWQLSGIAVKTPPTKTAYVIDEYFDPAGLVLSTTMTDATDNTITKAGADVAYTSDNASDFGFSPALTTPLTESVTSVTISYGGKSTSQAITVTAGGGIPKTSTLSFTAQCGGSGTADDGAEWTVTSDGTESNFDSTKGIHYGTGKAQVGYIRLSTSDITGTISKVVVNASTASGVTASVSVTVDGSSFGGDAQSLSTSATDYTFEGSASGEIVVNVAKPSKASNALYVKSVVVTYIEE